MLRIILYASLASAFFLPWCVGGLIKFHKTGEKKNFLILLAISAVCILLITFISLLSVIGQGSVS